MTTEERIAQLEEQIVKLQQAQSDLFAELARAQRDQWQGRIDDLELQMHLGAADASDKATALLEQLNQRWSEARSQFDRAAATAGDVSDILRAGLETAIRDLRAALMAGRSKIS